MNTQATSTTARRNVQAGSLVDANGVRRLRLSRNGAFAPWPNRVGIAALGIAVLSALVLFSASGAQAASYTAGAPLSTPGMLTSGVAVDQSSHDVYVAACGTRNGELQACIIGSGAFKEFSSAGGELACSLEGGPVHPSSVAVDPTTGDIDVLNVTGVTASEMLVYGANCGTKLHEFPVATGGEVPIPESVVNPSGEIIVPNPHLRRFEACSQVGVCSELGASRAFGAA
ncbi:MAG TPA: hypothetical protein VFW38_02155, partial [Solirubrobacteraceae bacterium]|nr:hypothetical protein [Solirubrobacteraceae bacterium]